MSSEIPPLEKKEAIEFLQEIRATIKGATKEEQIKELMERCNEDVLESSIHLNHIFGAEGVRYFDEDEETYEYRLNELGASFVLDTLEEIDRKEFTNILSQHVRGFEDTIIVDDNFLRKLVRQNISNGVHYSLYLRNYIGLVGLTNLQRFDPYTYILNTKFLEKSREEVLNVFFEEFTPGKLITYMRTKIDSNHPYVKRTLNKEEFLEDGTISTDGMKKLLEGSGIAQKAF